MQIRAPPVEVERGPDGTVTLCMDYVRKCGRDQGGGCQRSPCRYFHPPTHLLTAIRSKLLHPLPPNTSQQQQPPLTSCSAVAPFISLAASPFYLETPQCQSTQQQQINFMSDLINGNQQTATFQQQNGHNSVVQNGNGQHQLLCQQQQPQQTVLTSQASLAIQQQQQAIQQQQAVNAVPAKRPAMEKSGMPVYQPAMVTSQQQAAVAALAGHQLTINPYGQLTAAFPQTPALQSYIPVSFAGHPPSMPRF